MNVLGIETQRKPTEPLGLKKKLSGIFGHIIKIRQTSPLSILVIIEEPKKFTWSAFKNFLDKNSSKSNWRRVVQSPTDYWTSKKLIEIRWKWDLLSATHMAIVTKVVRFDESSTKFDGISAVAKLLRKDS